jgi:hypothetical protein
VGRETKWEVGGLEAAGHGIADPLDNPSLGLAVGVLAELRERKLPVGFRIENGKTGTAAESMLRIVVLPVPVPPEISRFSRALTILPAGDPTGLPRPPGGLR